MGHQPPSSWSRRQREVEQCWQQARPHNVDNLLSAQTLYQVTCNHCQTRDAVIRCGECMPLEWFCAECDQLAHKRHTLHSRQTTMAGFLQYIPPTESVKRVDCRYIVSEQGEYLLFNRMALIFPSQTILIPLEIFFSKYLLRPKHSYISS